MARYGYLWALLRVDGVYLKQKSVYFRTVLSRAHTLQLNSMSKSITFNVLVEYCQYYKDLNLVWHKMLKLTCTIF